MQHVYRRDFDTKSLKLEFRKLYKRCYSYIPREFCNSLKRRRIIRKENDLWNKAPVVNVYVSDP